MPQVVVGAFFFTFIAITYYLTITYGIETNNKSRQGTCINPVTIQIISNSSFLFAVHKSYNMAWVPLNITTRSFTVTIVSKLSKT